MRRRLLVVAAAVIVVVAVVLMFSNLDKLVAKAIEKFGGDATGTRVAVSGVDISLREGRGSIRGLRVTNPEGYKGRTALSLDDITIAIDIKSVREDPVVIDEIRIKAPVVYAEIARNGQSNIEALRKRVESYAGKSAGGSGESAKPERRLRIMKFVFEEGRVEVDAGALGLERKTIALPEIRLDDIGGSSGATPEEITREILTAVARRTASAIAGSEIDGLIKQKLGESAVDKAKGVLEKVFK
jgi:hypothetical protein